MSRRRDLVAVAAFCGLFGLAAWALYLHFFAGALGEGWMVYDNAVRSYFEGTLPLLYDGVRSTAQLNTRFAAWLPQPLPLHPWLYPPHYLVLLLPFGLLPFAAAGVLFLVLGFGGMAAAGGLFVRDGGARGLFAGALLLCPASALTVCIGQNSFLTCALLLAGFGLVERRPVLGGALLGCLTYKPQLWLMVPVALVAGRQWRAAAAAVAAALALSLLSVATFGVEAWRDWIALMTEPSTLYDQWSAIARLNGQSIYANAILLGASVPTANLAQAAAVLVSAGCVWRCYRRPMPRDLGLAVLLAATMLAAPHVINYDAVLLGTAAALFFHHAYHHGSRPGDTAIALLAWASPLANPPSVFPVGLLTPPLIILFMAWVMARGRHETARIAAGSVLNPA